MLGKIIIGLIIVVVILYGYSCYTKSSKDCVICLTVRDVEQYIDALLLNIQKLTALFDKTQIVFYYDKSSDNTIQKLREYQTKLDNIHISLNISL